MTSPVLNSSGILRKINSIASRARPFRVAILGQNGVGKTAFVVRFVTGRYIGEYDPLLERVYPCQRKIGENSVDFEVWDTAGVNENSKLKEQIRWADAIILIYDVTDRCSFNECSRLKFLVNAHSRRAKRKSGSDPHIDATCSLPVFLVGNKSDKEKDRMVTAQEGCLRSMQLNCVRFYEVSVQEDVDDVADVFHELYTTCRKYRRFPANFASSISSVFAEKAGFSSDEDCIREGDEERYRGRRGTFSSPTMSPRGTMASPTVSRRGAVTSPIVSRRGTLTSPIVSRRGTLAPQLTPSSASLPQDDLIQRARSRRREAFYTVA